MESHWPLLGILDQSCRWSNEVPLLKLRTAVGHTPNYKRHWQWTQACICKAHTQLLQNDLPALMLVEVVVIAGAVALVVWSSLSKPESSN